MFITLKYGNEISELFILFCIRYNGISYCSVYSNLFIYKHGIQYDIFPGFFFE